MQTDIHAWSGIRTHDASVRAAKSVHALDSADTVIGLVQLNYHLQFGELTLALLQKPSAIDVRIYIHVHWFQQVTSGQRVWKLLIALEVPCGVPRRSVLGPLPSVRLVILCKAITYSRYLFF
jgi:hypothetical protein